MDSHGQNSYPGLPARNGTPEYESTCPDCAERAALRALVVELLYKNEVLRFDLLTAHQKLARSGNSELTE